MFTRKENKSLTAPSAKHPATEALRSNLRELEHGESQIADRLRSAKDDLRKAQSGLELAEDDFINGAILFAELSTAREAVINALRGIDPIEGDLSQQRALLERCKAALKRAEAEETATAKAELGSKFDEWRARFARALTDIVELNLEGEAIMDDARRSCPDLAAGNQATLPLRELSGRYATAAGCYAPTLPGGLRWLFDARRAGVAVPQGAIELLGEYLAQVEKLEVADDRMRRQREVAAANFDRERELRHDAFYNPRRTQFLEGGRVTQ